jgi:hypothetical protein
MKTLISRAIVAKLETLEVIKSVEFDKIRLTSDDFMSVECPAIQLIALAETNEHERSRAKKLWNIALELVMKSTPEAPLSQVDLWNTQYRVERVLWSLPNLGIPGVIHLRYLGNQTDLHLIEPYYVVRMDLEALYYDPLVTD